MEYKVLLWESESGGLKYRLSQGKDGLWVRVEWRSRPGSDWLIVDFLCPGRDWERNIVNALDALIDLEREGIDKKKLLTELCQFCEEKEEKR
ncbi:hypothetical protein DRZ78_03090 [Candidatus Aerophobetes bacterium]|uniref:Uncharacterized protein n=1 Tax=Aerophobetes bacterium TaxID=2030807 RepID=A0A662D3B8_UNCAE|nr:MAG: hypothetical protein DRZ78_03090 [Candidatus Aerophobetes bacterium]